jgi:glucose/mannose-6-phosphate isomerase
MNLDDFKAFPQIDSQNMLAEIDQLPEQLQTAWDLGMKQPLPNWQGIQQVAIAGMGGSAIGGDLLCAFILPSCSIPVIVHRNYDLPAWANGARTLVIVCSHSGNTEETISAFQKAQQNGCRMLVVTTGGKLVRLAQEHAATVWTFSHAGQPRAAVGYSFGLLLAFFARMNWIPDPAGELQQAVADMADQQAYLRADVPIVSNPAKRLAGQLMGRWVSIFGSDILEPVARRLKCQINELAKTWAQFEALPEADHNTMAGVTHPVEGLYHTMALFLRARSCHSRNQLRTNLTKQMVILEGVNTDFINATGETRLSQLWTALHFGDYLAYYLAMAYDIDPTPIPSIEGFKEELARSAQA